jgi:hypothetical protein
VTMQTPPCSDEKQRAYAAAKEWERATEATQPFRVNHRPAPDRPPSPKPPEYLRDLEAAFQREAEARQAYINAMTVWFNCEKRQR